MKTCKRNTQVVVSDTGGKCATLL